MCSHLIVTHSSKDLISLRKLNCYGIMCLAQQVDEVLESYFQLHFRRGKWHSKLNILELCFCLAQFLVVHELEYWENIPAFFFFYIVFAFLKVSFLILSWLHIWSVSEFFNIISRMLFFPGYQRYSIIISKSWSLHLFLWILLDYLCLTYMVYIFNSKAFSSISL